MNTSIGMQKSITLPGILSPNVHTNIAVDDRTISSQQDTKVELKRIDLPSWQQGDLNQDAERIHFTASYYTKKGNKLLLIGTCIQFSMLLLSLSGSYISTFGNFDDSSKSILMSCLNMTTAILSGIYTFFAFTKKGQSYKEGASVLFSKIEKTKCIISTLLSDKEYEELKRSLVDTLLKYDTECIREKYNGNNFIPIYRHELEKGISRRYNRETNEVECLPIPLQSPKNELEDL